MASAPPVSRGKNKTTAGILGILIGSLGIHHFYLGSNMAGVVCIITACCGIGGIIGVIEGIMLLVMSDADFDRKYNYRTPESMEFVWTKV